MISQQMTAMQRIKEELMGFQGEKRGSREALLIESKKSGCQDPTACPMWAQPIILIHHHLRQNFISRLQKGTQAEHGVKEHSLTPSASGLGNTSASTSVLESWQQLPHVLPRKQRAIILGDPIPNKSDPKNPWFPQCNW